MNKTLLFETLLKTVWNFSARSSDFISRGNQWRPVVSQNIGYFLRLRSDPADILCDSTATAMIAETLARKVIGESVSFTM